MTTANAPVIALAMFALPARNFLDAGIFNAERICGWLADSSVLCYIVFAGCFYGATLRCAAYRIVFLQESVNRYVYQYYSKGYMHRTDLPVKQVN